MADNPFTGSWTYRSLLKQPRGSIPFDQLQFVNVTRQGGLADVKALAFEDLLQCFLAFDRAIVEQVENRFVAGCLGHE